MTVNDKTLAELRASLNEGMYRSLLPLLCCVDVTWDETSGQIMLGQEVFASTYRLHRRCIWRIEVKNKFRRIGNIISIDISSTSEINNRRIIESFYSGGYRHTNIFTDVMHTNRNRQPAAAHVKDNANVLIFGHVRICDIF